MKIEKRYKFLSVNEKEINVTQRNYPVKQIVPYGPDHEDIKAAEVWLEGNVISGRKYLLVPLYSIKN
jgi:hypothetical protein